MISLMICYKLYKIKELIGELNIERQQYMEEIVQLKEQVVKVNEQVYSLKQENSNLLNQVENLKKRFKTFHEALNESE